MADIQSFLSESFGTAKAAVEETVNTGVSSIQDFLNKFSSSQKQEAPVQQQAPQQHTIETLFPKLIQAESRGQHTDAKTGKLTTSPVGAEGITQLMPKTAAKPGFGIEPVKDKSEGEYLRVGKEYLGKLLDKFGNDAEKALAAYNAGLGNVQKAVGQAERFGGEWKDYLPKKGETIPYINKILGKGEKSALNTPKNKMYVGTSGAQMLENVKATAYDVASLAPVTGELLSAKDAFEQAKKGEFSSAALSAIGAIPVVGSVGKAASRVGIAEHFFKVPFDSKTGYASVLNNPIHLKDGTRLSGFTDAGQTTFHGYDKNGERFTVRADKISPEDIVSSKDSNKTAEYVKKQLSPSEPPVTYYHGTTTDFKEFDLTKGYKGMAFFTPDESFAKVYSKEDGRVIKANLNLKNPASYEEYKKVRKAVGTSNVAEALKAKGYDGVVDTKSPPMVIVFDKEQIKMLGE